MYFSGHIMDEIAPSKEFVVKEKIGIFGHLKKVHFCKESVHHTGWIANQGSAILHAHLARTGKNLCRASKTSK